MIGFIVTSFAKEWPTAFVEMSEYLRDVSIVSNYMYFPNETYLTTNYLKKGSFESQRDQIQRLRKDERRFLRPFCR